MNNFKTQDKVYQCATCGLKLNTRVGLREHSKVHESDQPNVSIGYGPVRRWRMPLKDVA